MKQATSKQGRALFVRLPDSVLGQLRTLAEANGVVVNNQAMVKWAVTQFVNQHDNNPNNAPWRRDDTTITPLAVDLPASRRGH